MIELMLMCQTTGRLNQHNNYQVLNRFPYGLRQGFSCEAQLASVVEGILFALDNLYQVDLILLDFCKAFDAVPHHHLLVKLQLHRIKNKTHVWITSWLAQRMQRVVIDVTASRWLPVKSGVPQRMILGPLMFLIYINDIGKDLPCCLRLFADDCFLYQVISSEEGCAKLQHDLDSLYKTMLGK